jgi:hypothetical protein
LFERGPTCGTQKSIYLNFSMPHSATNQNHIHPYHIKI